MHHPFTMPMEEDLPYRHRSGRSPRESLRYRIKRYRARWRIPSVSTRMISGERCSKFSASQKRESVARSSKSAYNSFAVWLNLMSSKNFENLRARRLSNRGILRAGSNGHTEHINCCFNNCGDCGRHRTRGCTAPVRVVSRLPVYS